MTRLATQTPLAARVRTMISACSRLAKGVALLGALAVVCTPLLSGCANLPPPVHRAPTAAIADYESTNLAALTRKALPLDMRSGFRLLPYGPNSFATRIELTKLATRSLDVQYYLLKGDNTGLALMGALRNAAARGVRVRVLLDDLYTAGEDDSLLALASFPNVEVRLFNPFAAGRAGEFTRFISSGLDFSRVNRRMHNKLFIADNVAAVAGGRNMADEYVMNAEGANFIDVDIFAAGPVVRDLSNEFDHYWNSDVVYSIESIAHSQLTRERLQQIFEAQTQASKPPEAQEIPKDGKLPSTAQRTPTSLPPDEVLMLNLPFELASQDLTPLVPANARVIFDPLTKTAGDNEERNSIEGTVTEGVIKWLETARQHIKLVSPYFVPSDAAVANLVRARHFGLGVELVTNSLASTDEPWVYAGYWPHLKELLLAGIDVYEISPSLSVKRRRLGIFGHRTGALHMKNAILDHKEVFLGSMNLDQRSAKLNTELGLIIDSAELAMQLEAFADADSSYRLRLSDDDKHVQWVGEQDGRETVYDEPPETTAWLRIRLRLFGPLIPAKEL